MLSRAAVLVTVLLAVTACGSAPGATGARSGGGAADRGVPPLWRSSVARPPDGFHRVTCARVKGARPARAVSVVVPDSYVADYAQDGDCQFGSKGASLEVVVAPDGSLADYRKKEVDPFVGEAGDEEVFHPVYVGEAKDAVGGRIGETLGFGIANDGQGGDLHLAQADGVRLRLDTDDGASAAHRAEFQAMRDSVGVRSAKHAPGAPTPSGTPAPSTSRVG